SMILVPLFDLKFLRRTCGTRCRNFKSAALTPSQRRRAGGRLWHGASSRVKTQAVLTRSPASDCTRPAGRAKPHTRTRRSGRPDTMTRRIGHGRTAESASAEKTVLKKVQGPRGETFNAYNRPHADLREFIARAESAGEIVRIRGADWKLE